MCIDVSGRLCVVCRGELERHRDLQIDVGFRGCISEWLRLLALRVNLQVAVGGGFGKLTADVYDGRRGLCNCYIRNFAGLPVVDLSSEARNLLFNNVTVL